MKEHEERINRIIACGMVIGCIIIADEGIIPYIRDIPYIRREEYKIVTGRAGNQDRGGRNVEEKRTVQVISEDGSKVDVHFFSDHIDEGEKLTVVYLPYTKFGTRIENQADVINDGEKELSEKEILKYLIYAIGMLIIFLITYKNEKKHSKLSKGTVDDYRVIVPPILKQVYMLMFVVGMILYGAFFIAYLKNGIKKGHLWLALLFAFIGIIAIFFADKWEIVVSENKMKICPLLKHKLTIDISEIEKAKIGSKKELEIYYKGKKIITVDRLCINCDKLCDTLRKYNKL